LVPRLRDVTSNLGQRQFPDTINPLDCQYQAVCAVDVEDSRTERRGATVVWLGLQRPDRPTGVSMVAAGWRAT